MTTDTTPMLTMTEFRTMLLDRLERAESGNPDAAPFGYSNEESQAWLSGAASELRWVFDILTGAGLVAPVPADTDAGKVLLSQEDVMKRLHEAHLVTAYNDPKTGEQGYYGGRVMVGITKQDVDTTPLAFVIYPCIQEGARRGAAMQLRQTLKTMFADAGNIEIEQPVGQAIAGAAA